MTRKRMTGTTLENWTDVDACLKRIAEIDRDLGLIASAQQEAIDQIKENAKNEAEPLQTIKAGLEAAIQQYCEAHRSDFIAVKSRELTFGTVGFRLSTRVVIKRVADTLQALRDFGLDECIRVKEEINKEAMRDLPLDTLHAVGAALKTEDAFGYEVKREALAEKA